MGLFSFFGESEHRVFNYRPVYYDEAEEARRQKFGEVDGTRKKEAYVPGSYIKGTFREGARTKGHFSKIQKLIGMVTLLLIAAVLYYIAKFYSIL